MVRNDNGDEDAVELNQPNERVVERERERERAIEEDSPGRRTSGRKVEAGGATTTTTTEETVLSLLLLLLPLLLKLLHCYLCLL